jgi:hypothetical protein
MTTPIVTDLTIEEIQTGIRLSKMLKHLFLMVALQEPIV